MKLIPLSSTDILRFRADMQEAFQKGFEEYFGKTEEIILPEKDIDQSLHFTIKCSLCLMLLKNL